MKKIIISIILLNITVLFYSIYFNKASNNYFAINDDITQVDDTNEETDNSEDLLDDIFDYFEITVDKLNITENI